MLNKVCFYFVSTFLTLLSFFSDTLASKAVPSSYSDLTLTISYMELLTWSKEIVKFRVPYALNNTSAK